MKCPICEREMIDGPSIGRHHLMPKTFGGKETIEMHRICHRKIHSLLTDRELQHIYHTVQTLLQHEGIQKFVKWVSKKDPEFYDVSKDTQRIRNRKRKR